MYFFLCDLCVFVCTTDTEVLQNVVLAKYKNHPYRQKRILRGIPMNVGPSVLDPGSRAVLDLSQT